MAYPQQSWANGQAGNTPITAERLTHIEEGLGGVADTVDDHSAQLGIIDMGLPIMQENLEGLTTRANELDNVRLPGIDERLDTLESAPSGGGGSGIPVGDVAAFDVLTQAQYDALGSKSASTVYIIQG